MRKLRISVPDDTKHLLDILMNGLLCYLMSARKYFSKHHFQSSFRGAMQQRGVGVPNRFLGLDDPRTTDGRHTFCSPPADLITLIPDLRPYSLR